MSSGIRARIFSQRNRLGLSEEEILKMMPGVSINQYVQWERGTKNFSAEEIKMLTKALGCSADYLINGVEQPSKEYVDVINKAIRFDISADMLNLFVEMIKNLKEA